MMMLPMCMHSGFLLEDQSRQSWHHEMTSQGSLMLFREGTIKGEHTWTLGCCMLYFWYWMFRSANNSQTLYSSCLSAFCGAEHNQNELCALFIHMKVPRPFWGTFSQCNFSCLMIGHYLHPLEPGIDQSMDHNPSAVDCEGGINH